MAKKKRLSLLKRMELTPKALSNLMREGGIDIGDTPIKANPFGSQLTFDDSGKINGINSSGIAFDSQTFGKFKAHNSPLYKLISKGLNGIGTTDAKALDSLLLESMGNINSWRALKKALKDKPELLKQFGDLRSTILKPSYYGKLLGTSRIPGKLGGGVIGGGVGNYLSGKAGDYFGLDKSDINYKALKSIGTLGGAAGGYALGGRALPSLLNLAPTAVKSLIKAQGADPSILDKVGLGKGFGDNVINSMPTIGSALSMVLQKDPTTSKNIRSLGNSVLKGYLKKKK